MSAESSNNSQSSARPGTRIVIAAATVLFVIILVQLFASTSAQRPFDSEYTGLLLDINRADAAQLRHLPGIGPQLANRIVDHRITTGTFDTVDDLEEVRGIGPRTLQRMRRFLLPDITEANNVTASRQTALK